jgi:hypothetical protein
VRLERVWPKQQVVASSSNLEPGIAKLTILLAWIDGYLRAGGSKGLKSRKEWIASAESLAVRGWLVRRLGRRKNGSAAAP